LEFDARLVIGAARFLLLEERQRRIGSKGCLFTQSPRHVDLSARCPQPWFVLERTGNSVVQRQAADRIEVRRSRGRCRLRLSVRDNSQCKGVDDDCGKPRSH
jgi:hypothetical protein